MQTAQLILASTSATRINMLRGVGLEFESRAAELDESLLQVEHKHLSPPKLALKLAEAKVLSLSTKTNGDFIIGSDQVLDFSARALHKAKTIEEARTKLQALRGHTHHLRSAVAVAQGGQVVFSALESAALTMRYFSDAFLENYLVQAEDACLHSAGCYHYEGRGAQLFEKVEGDYYVILGMPLLPLLAFLRQSSILPA